MSEYIDGFIVEVKEAADAVRPALQRSVAREHVRVELQVLRHVSPVKQLYATPTFITVLLLHMHSTTTHLLSTLTLLRFRRPLPLIITDML